MSIAALFEESQIQKIRQQLELQQIKGEMAVLAHNTSIQDEERQERRKELVARLMENRAKEAKLGQPKIYEFLEFDWQDFQDKKQERERRRAEASNNRKFQQQNGKSRKLDIPHGGIQKPKPRQRADNVQGVQRYIKLTHESYDKYTKGTKGYIRRVVKPGLAYAFGNPKDSKPDLKQRTISSYFTYEGKYTSRHLNSLILAMLVLLRTDESSYLLKTTEFKSVLASYEDRMKHNKVVIREAEVHDVGCLFPSLPRQEIRDAMNELITRTKAKLASMRKSGTAPEWIAVKGKGKDIDIRYIDKVPTEHQGYFMLTWEQLPQLLELDLETSWFKAGSFLFRQVDGIPIGIQSGFSIATMVMDRIFQKAKMHVPRQIRAQIFWYIYADDCIRIGTPQQLMMLKDAMDKELPSQLKLELTGDSTQDPYVQYLQLEVNPRELERLRIHLKEKMRFPDARGNMSDAQRRNMPFAMALSLLDHLWEPNWRTKKPAKIGPVTDAFMSAYTIIAKQMRTKGYKKGAIRSGAIRACNYRNFPKEQLQPQQF
jgi:hypothetical protein